ncbi:MFS transporter [Thalassotalea sp. LPB0316]|uniref:glycoside-pentoside-hexuronide (GPH):cation symporter n=1 Tax=Thalassotalea sp. LPB0316 TaxID=2769490 RepID=UPI0018683902|nr:MFS transporter [Thalassotalea sp. LPB0316]QOL24555.1 MFS transporter [Thalassotalea sp. LPB0316]
MISVKEKIAYGLGDTASNIIFQTVMTFLMLYYTDVVGLDAAVVGTMFLAVRIFDAVTDPLMGSIADRTQTRWGHYRPYLLWLALPFAIISVLAFTTPDLEGNAKIIYCFTTYSLLMIAYTAINIPYCALGGVLTADAKERVTVQSYRFVFGMLGGLIVAACTMPLVEFFGQGDDAKGYQLAMTAMSILGFILFILCFAGTKERIEQPKDQSLAFFASLKHLWQNDQWRILCLVALFLLSGQVLKFTLAVYYVKYYLGDETLMTPFITAGVFASMVGCAVAQPLAQRVCKIKAYISLQVIAATICALAYFIKPDQIVLAFAAFILWKFFLDMATPLLWAKMADTIDYGHEKTGVRITGLVYSGVIFFIKMGVALGGAFAGWLMAFYDYQPNIEQTQATKDGILLSFTILPALGSYLAAAVMAKYTLNEQKLEHIQSKLKLSAS